MRLDKSELKQLAQHEGNLERARFALEGALQEFNAKLQAALNELTAPLEAYSEARDSAFAWVEDIVNDRRSQLQTMRDEHEFAPRHRRSLDTHAIEQWIEAMEGVMYKLGDYALPDLPEPVAECLEDQPDEILRDMPAEPEE